VAYLTRALRAQAGIVISASHNLFEDNGIKFFSGFGTKLADDIECSIEAALDQSMPVQPSVKLGKARRINDAVGRYIEFCKSTFPNDLDLRGLKIVVDCAHGATYHIAPHVLHELGAEVVSLAIQPDGLNINHECGSTHPQAMQQAVLDHGADLGIALDGDGDRLIMADSTGKLLDGDELLYIIAAHRQKSGQLQGGVVGTLMTNLAFEHAVAKLGIPFMRAPVGDRYVLEMMNAKGWLLGGENSGHILCLDRHTSGDGIIAALQVLAAMREDASSLQALAADLTLYPQVLVNVQVKGKVDLGGNATIQSAVKNAEQQLNGTGRVLLRASGTESKIRVMVEGQQRQQVEILAAQIAEAVSSVC
jgi:phosphoglucosamine mutase